MRLAWSGDPENYAGDSVATGRVSHAGEVKGSDDSDETEHSGPPGWGLGGRPTTSQDLTETSEGSDREKTICLKEKDLRRMEAPLDGGQGPKGALVPYMDGRTDGWMVCGMLNSYLRSWYSVGLTRSFWNVL